MLDANELARLRRSEELYRLTVENASDAIFLTDDDGAWRYVCPNCHVTFGWEATEVLAMEGLGALLGAEVIDPARLDAEGELANVEVSSRDRAGQRRELLVHVKRVAILDATVLVVVRDVTELRRLGQQAEQGRRLAALDRFARGVVHDLRNWLLVIRASTAILASRRGDAELAEHLEAIDGAVEGGERLAHDLSAYAREGAPEMKPLDLADALRDVEPALARVAPEHALTVDVAPALPPVRLGVSALSRICVNLVLNAAESMERAGRIRIEAKRVTSPAPRRMACGAVMPPGDWVRVTVADDGPGFSQDAREHAFEPYFSTKSRADGGIGLAACLGLARIAHGFMAIEREGEPGAVVALYLPPAPR